MSPGHWEAEMVQTAIHIGGIGAMKCQRGREKGNDQELSSDSLRHFALCVLDMIARSPEAQHKQRVLVLVSDAHCVQLGAQKWTGTSPAEDHTGEGNTNA